MKWITLLTAKYPALVEVFWVLVALVLFFILFQLFVYIDQAAANEVGTLNGRAVINLARLK